MMDLLKYSVNGIIGACLALSLFSCKEEASEYVANQNFGPALGTSYHITYIGKEELNFEKEIDSVFNAINKSMSTYLPDSDISKINKGDTTVVVDEMFKEVFGLSNKINKTTKGYFDPTVGTLVNAWGFGPGEKIELDSAKVDSLLEFVGFGKVKITNEGTVVKDNPNIYFDFNAVAKGYAIDRLAAMLDKKGITDYLVEVGGEIVVKGTNKVKDQQWTIGVDDPQGDDRSKPKLKIHLKDKAMASSGNYRKFRVDSITGEKYVHTINPITGFTKNSDVLATTVLANTCAAADAYATSFMAMDLEDTIDLLEEHKELEAYIIYLNSKGETMEFITMGFEALIVP